MIWERIPAPIQLFLIQGVMWCVLTINQRAIAHADYSQMIVTDLIIATLNFFVIKKIADQGNDGGAKLAGYVFGGVFGSVLGMMMSQRLLGR